MEKQAIQQERRSRQTRSLIGRILSYLFLFIWAVIVPCAYVLTRFTDLDIVPLYAIVQSLALIRTVIGLIFVHKKVWVKNLVD